MAATISAEHRDALFAHICTALYAFEDLAQAIESNDHELAYTVGRRIGDGLRLILDGGLGFAKRTVDPVTLKMSDEELRPIMSRIRREVDCLYESRRAEFEEGQRERAEITAVQDACATILEHP